MQKGRFGGIFGSPDVGNGGEIAATALTVGGPSAGVALQTPPSPLLGPGSASGDPQPDGREPSEPSGRDSVPSRGQAHGPAFGQTRDRV